MSCLQNEQKTTTKRGWGGGGGERWFWQVCVLRRKLSFEIHLLNVDVVTNIVAHLKEDEDKKKKKRGGS